MVLCRLFSPLSLPKAGPPGAGADLLGLCPAGHWASKDRNSIPTLGRLCQCLTSFAIIRKSFFFCLGGNSMFLFVASYPNTGHYWEKCICCPLPRFFSTQLTVCLLATCIPRAFPTKLLSSQFFPSLYCALEFSSPVQGFAFPLLNFTSFLLADCYLFLHD